jgi:hypothetical protein
MQIILLVVTMHACQYQRHERRTDAYSGVSRLKKSKSIAAENAANATPPPKAARGPALRARMPPDTKPAETELYISFFARYCKKCECI